MLFSLLGCNEEVTPSSLATPQNLRVENDILRWSIVEGAVGYVVQVNHDSYSSVSNFFDLSSLKLAEGTYSLRVQATGNGTSTLSSEFSGAVSYVAAPTLSGPTGDNGGNVGNGGENVQLPTSSAITNLSTSKRITAYISQPTQTLSIYNSINTGDYYVWYFDLGTVNRTPLYTSMAMQYDYDMDATLLFSEMTEDRVESSLSSAIEVIDTHSYTGGFEVGGEAKFAIGGDVVIGNAKAEISVKASTDHHWTNNWGSVQTDTTTTTNSYLTQYSKGFQLSLPFREANGFVRGNSYRVAFYESVRLFGVLLYDVAEETYTVAYHSTFLPNHQSLVIEESQNGVFEYDRAKDIIFDVDAAIALAEENIPPIAEGDVPGNKNLGTKEDPFLLSKPEDFAEIAAKDGPGVYFALTGDIDFEGAEYSHFYTPLEEFQGILLGRGHAIQHYKISLIDSRCAGFFKTVSGTVKDVWFSECEFAKTTNSGGNEHFAGIVCGINYGTLSNIIVSSSRLSDAHMGQLLVDTDHRTYAGALCGQSEVGSVIEKCGSSNNVVYVSARTGFGVADAYAGGIVGRTYASLTHCYARGNRLTAYTKGSTKGIFQGTKGSLYSYAGGIVGRAFGGASLQYCVVYGNTLTATAEEAHNHMYKDSICPELNGSKAECYEQKGLPASFPKNIWATDSFGQPIIRKDLAGN